jgi:hypothetical protein
LVSLFLIQLLIKDLVQKRRQNYFHKVDKESLSINYVLIP